MTDKILNVRNYKSTLLGKEKLYFCCGGTTIFWQNGRWGSQDSKG
jgi:hypothetical protein